MSRSGIKAALTGLAIAAACVSVLTLVLVGFMRLVEGETVEVDLSKGAKHGDVSVSLGRTYTGTVRLGRASFFVGERTSTDSYFCVTLSITNNHPGRRLTFVGWGAAARLHDEHGNVYAPVHRVDDAHVQGQITSCTIDPGESVEDFLVFERPVKEAKSLVLTLPMKHVKGQNGFLRCVVPRDFSR